MTKKLLLLLFCLYCSYFAYGQALQIKTNLLSDAFFSPNIGLDIFLINNITVDLTFHYNPFSSGDDKRWKHWMVQPELRYWFCRPFTTGHFVGIHALGGEYNVGGVKLPLVFNQMIRENRYEGWGVGGGLSYGYHWIVSPRWGIEASVGVGFIHTQYDRFRCGHCGDRLGSGFKNWIGPTKASVSLIYVLK